MAKAKDKKSETKPLIGKEEEAKSKEDSKKVKKEGTLFISKYESLRFFADGKRKSFKNGKYIATTEEELKALENCGIAHKA